MKMTPKFSCSFSSLSLSHFTMLDVSAPGRSLLCAHGRYKHDFLVCAPGCEHLHFHIHRYSYFAYDIKYCLLSKLLRLLAASAPCFHLKVEMGSDTRPSILVPSLQSFQLPQPIPVTQGPSSFTFQ